MKNRDLIKELLNYNLDADVTTTSDEDIVVSFISEDSFGNELTKESTKQLFIEGVDDCMTCSHQYINEEEDEAWCQYYDKACGNIIHCDAMGDYVPL